MCIRDSYEVLAHLNLEIMQERLGEGFVSVFASKHGYRQQTMGVVKHLRRVGPTFALAGVGVMSQYDGFDVRKDRAEIKGKIG